MYTVYVLESTSSGKIYIGQTKNLDLRLKRHNQQLPIKATGYTAKNKGPWQVIYQEKFETRTEAQKREKQLKSHTGRDVIRNLGR